MNYANQIGHTLIGEEFQALFLSTTEPINEDGNVFNPTKSPCDRYVFNTVLTRAKSLVVVVGSPRILLNTEKHMVKLYGEKGRCWSLYLKSCLEHGTLKIPQLVEPNQSIAQRFKEELAAHLGATLSNDQTVQSFRCNYRMYPKDAEVVTTSSTHAGSVAHSGSSHPVATHSKSVIRPVHRSLSSDENVRKQISSIEDMAPVNVQTTMSTYSHPMARKRLQKGSVQEPRAEAVEGVDQALSVKSVAKQVDYTLTSNEKANLARPIKLESSESLHKHDLEVNQHTRSRGNK